MASHAIHLGLPPLGAEKRASDRDLRHPNVHAAYSRADMPGRAAEAPGFAVVIAVTTMLETRRIT